MKARSGILDAQDPAFRIIRSAVAPAYADAAGMGVLDGIENQVLGNAPDLDGISIGGKPRGAFALQVQSALQCDRTDTLAQRLQNRRHIHGLDLADLAA